MKNEKGITLVELLAVLAITGIIVVAIMSVFSTGANSSERTASRQQLQQEANLIVEQVRAVYLKNEKLDSFEEQFDVKIEGNKLRMISKDTVGNIVLSESYEYYLKKDNLEPNKNVWPLTEITLDRTKLSPFHLKICSKKQCFEVHTAFSKLK